MTAIALYRSPELRALESRYADQPLMQRAGAAAAAWAEELATPLPGPILVLAGPGNNGGDALVAARLLCQRFFEVVVVFAADPARLPQDAARAYQSYLQAGGTISENIPAQARWALIIDGIFGIGLTRPPTDCYADWIHTANQLAHRDACPLLALDCPSGLDADSGCLIGDTIQASHTLTFIAAKPGLFTGSGPDRCGQVRIAALELELADQNARIGELIAPESFTDWLRPRARDSHKGTYGSAGILGGAQSMVGAAFLAGRAALKLGTGRVYAGLLDPLPPALDILQPELMLRPPDTLLAADLTALACGPGLGTSPQAASLLAKALATDLPLVLDADALNLIAQEDKLQAGLTNRRASALLTPHPAEAARLLQCGTGEIQARRLDAAQEIAARYGCHTALKGCGTVIASPDGRWWINTSGNPGMATAGMGDVLTGLVVALLAQGWPAEAALLAAVHLHGAAADRLVAEGTGPIGLTAGEVVAAARSLFNDWCRPS